MYETARCLEKAVNGLYLVDGIGSSVSDLNDLIQSHKGSLEDVLASKDTLERTA